MSYTINDMRGELFASKNQQAGTNTNEKAKAQVWLNIGIEPKGLTNEDGSPVFITLPYNLALDTMPDANVNSSNKEFAIRQNSKNQLKALLIEAGMSLEPGQSQEVHLVCKVYRAKPSETLSASDSIVTKDAMAALLGM